MAIHDVVLDPDGDILVIVPGTPAEGLANNTGSHEITAVETQETQTETGTETATEEPTNNGAATDEVKQPDTSQLQGEQWQFKASSKHLALASTYVKKMLTGPWREANEVHEDGLLHWTFDGFDVKAISTTLHIIHGLNRRVPRTVDLSMLAQIARVVDYLGCHEAIELYASIWVAHLDKAAPAGSSSSSSSSSPLSKEDWDSWISITGVFQNPSIFQNWTRIAIVRKLACAPSLELPILAQAYDIIDQRRQHHLERIISCVYDHVDRLSELKTCSSECDAILLGTLIRQMRANSLTALRPARPYERLSIGSVVRAIRGLSVPEWYSKVNEADEPVQNPWEFWGASTKRISKMQRKKATLKAKRRASSNDVGWGSASEPAVEEPAEELKEIVVYEHTCGFGELIAMVNKLESEIKGLDLKEDLGILRVE